MEKARNKKCGSAVAMAVVVSAILLQFALFYMYQVRQARSPTHQIDERVRLKYLAHGITELALLKFQRFPAEFYSAWSHAQAGGDASILNAYAVGAAEFSNLTAADHASSSFNSIQISIKLATMTLKTVRATALTMPGVEPEVLYIRAVASYTARRGTDATHRTDAVRTVRTERNTSLQIPAPPLATP